MYAVWQLVNLTESVKRVDCNRDTFLPQIYLVSASQVLCVENWNLGAGDRKLCLVQCSLFIQRLGLLL